MSKKKKNILITAIALTAILCLGIIIRNVRYAKACDAFDKALEVYLEKVKVMDFACDKDGYISTVKVDVEVSHVDEGEKFEGRTYYYTMNVFLKDEFAELSDEEKCLLLSRYENAVRDELKRVREECGYEDCIKAIPGSASYEIKYRGRFIDIDRDVKVNFFNNYEYYNLDVACRFEITGFYGDDNYGTRIYSYLYSTLNDELTLFSLANRKSSKSTAPDTSTTSTTSSSSTKKRNTKKVYNDEPRDIDDVDIDSFYEDNKDEFEDYDDAWDYMEDHPEEWDDY